MKTLEGARRYAAQIHRDIADNIDGMPFPAHVTPVDRRNIAAARLRLADEIEAGQHDGNPTVAQRIHYYLTGEYLVLLP